MAVPAGKLFVYGGKGALGSECVAYFKARNWWVGCIDTAENAAGDATVVVTPGDTWSTQQDTVCQRVSDVLGDEKLDAILCLAGGWAGGNAASKDLVKNSELMWQQSVWTSVIAARLASRHLREGGLLALTGAQACLQGTPGMIGYGMAKAAVHQLVKSLVAPNSGLPTNSHVLAILPVTLDTPMNRKFMPKADQTKWTPLEDVAEHLYMWSRGVERPTVNGTLVQVLTADGKTQFVPA